MHRFVHIGQLGINWSELCSLFTFPVGFPLRVLLFFLEFFALSLWHMTLNSCLNVIFFGKL